MDYTRPVEAVIPGVQGRVLGVLARTEAELTMRTVAEVAGVSANQATTVLNRLVYLGLVQRRDVGTAALVRLARDNQAAKAVLALADLHSAVISELRGKAKRIRPLPACLVLFGSFARGAADEDSDIDVLAVPPARAAASTHDWSGSLGLWADQASLIAGNPVNLIEATLDELPRLIRREGSLWKSIITEGVVLIGTSPSKIRTAT